MIVRWLGTVEYLSAWRLQDELAELCANGEIDDTLLLLEHPPTLTLGRGTDRSHLLTSPNRLEQLGVAVHEVDRGGDVTYHGPGQLVGYPIFNLSQHRKDLHWFLREIEGALIDILAGWGLSGRRFPPHTGVWMGDRKIAAIGVKVRRWVSTHGFAVNVAPNLSHFDLIVPCGIREYGVTSLQGEGLQTVSVRDLLVPTAESFRARFGKECDSAPNSADPSLSPGSRAIWEQGEAL
jgi:lipoyl(octanoyl) transferase